MFLSSAARPVAILLIGLFIGWVVVSTTMERVFARTAPSIALAWSPGSAEANAREADRAFQTAEAVTPEVIAAARRSLMRQPIAPGPARLLGLAAGAEGPRAAALVRYAETMSRRDLGTQLWLIEERVAQDDVAGALVHYDRAMRTSVQGQRVLFPVLNAAASDRAVWEPLVAILARRPQWWRPFLVQFVPNAESAEAIHAIARRIGLTHGPGADPALLQAIQKRLVDLGAFARAADLYNRANDLPPETGAPLRNGDFAQPGGWDPFDWNLIDEPDLAAVRQPRPDGRGGDALFASAANGRGGDVAVQLVILAPGRHRIVARVGGVAGDPLARPRLAVRCAGDGPVIADARFPAAPENGVVWRTDFAVPPGCPAQRVAIMVSSALDPGDAASWIDDLSIVREGAR